MILTMNKAYIVGKVAEKKALLKALGRAGVVQVVPVQSSGNASLNENLIAQYEAAKRAMAQIEAVSGAEVRSDDQLTAEQAIAELNEIQKRNAEAANKMSQIERQLSQIQIWGNTLTSDLDALDKAGVQPQFALFKGDENLGENLLELSRSKEGRLIVSVYGAELPEGAVPCERPAKDRPTLLAEASELDARLHKDKERVVALSAEKAKVAKALAKLEDAVALEKVQKAAMEADGLFALQGWIPVSKVPELQKEFDEAGLSVAMQLTEPTDEDDPPTEIHYPFWVKPIKGLFDILGTVPGYREADLSLYFMIALPIFTAMLVGDAGYGLLFALAPILFRKKFVELAGRDMANLVIVFGVMTMIWGVLTANFFGITPENLAYLQSQNKLYVMNGEPANVTALIGSGTTLGAIAGWMLKFAPLYPLDSNGAPDSVMSRNLLMMISFALGSVHLIVAQLVQAWSNRKSKFGLSCVGFALFLAGMLGVVWQLIFGSVDDGAYLWMPVKVYAGLLIGGAVLIVFFSASNPIIGFVSNILNLISTFSDTMSYIRLMAVGMASYYIAYAFNYLVGELAGVSHWSLGLPVLLFGHILNVILCVIAIFAHGVRLNMLEFSNNAGVQWAGHAYAPFAHKAEPEG